MTDVFLICFSVVNPASFQNVKEEWVPELKEYAPNVPFLLVGTQVSVSVLVYINHLTVYALSWGSEFKSSRIWAAPPSGFAELPQQSAGNFKFVLFSNKQLLLCWNKCIGLQLSVISITYGSKGTSGEVRQNFLLHLVASGLDSSYEVIHLLLCLSLLCCHC